MTLQIQPLRSLDEMPPVVALQRTYWGDREDAVIHEHMLFSIASHGGHVLAATDGDAIAGVVIGLLGMNMEQGDRPAAESLHILSKRMVVSRDYRNHGLGTQLKLAQRDFALGQGVGRVVWTFDPLLAPNAHLNLHKLRAYSRSYRENYYGTDNTGGLSQDGTSDRLYVEWDLNDPVVEKAQRGDLETPSLKAHFEAGAVVLNPAKHTQDGFPVPGELREGLLIDELVVEDIPILLIETPLQFLTIQRESSALALEWRTHIRQVLGGAVRRGYQVVDFMRGEFDGAMRGLYILDSKRKR